MDEVGTVYRYVAVGNDVHFSEAVDGEVRLYTARVVGVVTKRPTKPWELTKDHECLVHLLVALPGGWVPRKNVACWHGPWWKPQAAGQWSWPAASLGGGPSS